VQTTCSDYKQDIQQREEKILIKHGIIWRDTTGVCQDKKNDISNTRCI